MALKSMKMESTIPQPEMADEYGYGLRINLECDQVEALGITKLPEPGTAMMIRARVVVVRTTTENDGEGPEHYMTLQITDMELGAVEKNKPAASMLYGED